MSGREGRGEIALTSSGTLLSQLMAVSGMHLKPLMHPIKKLECVVVNKYANKHVTIHLTLSLSLSLYIYIYKHVVKLHVLAGHSGLG